MNTDNNLKNANNEPTAKVSFGHQAEHLVNLDLIQPQDSRKVALNDNLMTFSKKFKKSLSNDSKARNRYLELLKGNHEVALRVHPGTGNFVFLGE